jgi:hypothetical protein
MDTHTHTRQTHTYTHHATIITLRCPVGDLIADMERLLLPTVMTGPEELRGAVREDEDEDEEEKEEDEDEDDDDEEGDKGAARREAGAVALALGRSLP